MLHINNYQPIVLHAWYTTKKNWFLKVYICSIHFNRYYSGSDHSSRLTTDVNAHMYVYGTDVTRWQIFRGSQWKRILLLQKCKETSKQPVQKQNMPYCNTFLNNTAPPMKKFDYLEKNISTSHQDVKDQDLEMLCVCINQFFITMLDSLCETRFFSSC